MIAENDRVSLRFGDISAKFDAVMRETRFSAWDIETDGLDFRGDAIRTCQIFVPGYGVEVVRLRPGLPPQRLIEALGSTRVFKIFHHAMFDLRFMRFQWGARARNVGCTKVASKIALPSRESHSLAGLVYDFLGHYMDKSERLSDWSVKDLTVAQIRYAADDTIFLPELLDALLREARKEGVNELIERSFDYIPVRVETDIRNCGDAFSY